MKLIFGLLLLISSAQAQTLKLQKGKAEITVKALIKKVKAESEQVKGKIHCESECEFLLAVPVGSFSSSDSNRDLNMLETIEADAYQLATAKGKFSPTILSSPSAKIMASVEFHGVTREYPVAIKEKGKVASFTLDLDAHGIKRPSFMTVKIENEVPIAFDLTWVEGP